MSTPARLERLTPLPAAAAVLLLLVPTAPPRPLLQLALSPALGAAVGVGLFGVLAGRAKRRFSPPAPLLLAAGLVVGASEEVIWRGFVLARTAPILGLAAAVAISACGFAAVHFPAQRLHGVAVHLVTGVVFGTAFAATGSLATAVAAHVAYNLLALTARGLPAAAAIRVRGLEKRFGRIAALGGIDLAIEEGEVVALLGPNGAGKTTLVEVVLGLRRPDRGAVEVYGERPGSAAARRLVSAAPQDMGFPPTLRVCEVVDFVLAHHRTKPGGREVLERFGLADIARRQVGGISGGQRRRLAVAIAFAPKPRLAILDEPTANLDVASRRQVWETIRGSATDGRTALLTTHHLEEAEALADRIVVLNEGRVVADGEPAALKRPGDASLEDAYLRLTGAAG